MAVLLRHACFEYGSDVYTRTPYGA